ncbi:MAG: ATP-binding protein [Deltaproteobacteria bacterium]|nr:ATP-binding protein [Deltaproteobacteria bacterium]
MYIERTLTQKLKQLASVFPAVVVTGARQVGKSTLLQHVFGDTADSVVFDPVLDIENARHDPELFLNNHRTPLILDEIQYAPELVAAIKRRIDINRAAGQYIITGSQQWGVLKVIAESLAGRAVFVELEGFSLAEIAVSQAHHSWLSAWLQDPSGFLAATPARLPLEATLYEQLWRGWLPEARFLPLENIPDFYTAYLRTYIERDVRLLAEVSDWQLFGRFVRISAALSAQEINYSHLGRELGLNPKTAERWLAILRATYQWYEIPAYSGNTVKRISGKSKGYIADTGLACTAQAISSPRAIGGHPLWGALFETAVAGEIRKLCAALSPKPNIYHWRTHAGAEVDLVLERDGIFFPIEIKAGTNPAAGDVSGIAAFRKTYPGLHIEKGLVIAPVNKIIALSENDYAIPWDLGGTT